MRKSPIIFVNFETSYLNIFMGFFFNGLVV